MKRHPPPQISRSYASRRRPRRADTQGGSITLEVAILGPALLLLIFTVVQASLWFYARSLALSAAQEGVNAGRAYHAPAKAGIARAQAFLNEHATDTLTDTHISSTGSTATQVSIQVTGHALSVIPGIGNMTVSQTAVGPIERLTTP
jgi:Flp pilus assembly protein TadG